MESGEEVPLARLAASPLDFVLAALPRALVLQCPPALQRAPARRLRWMYRADFSQFRSAL